MFLQVLFYLTPPIGFEGVSVGTSEENWPQEMGVSRAAQSEEAEHFSILRHSGGGGGLLLWVPGPELLLVNPTAGVCFLGGKEAGGIGLFLRILHDQSQSGCAGCRDTGNSWPLLP